VAMGDSKVTGASTVWLAYDDKNFYFAAKITDATPDEGMVRFEIETTTPISIPIRLRPRMVRS